MIVSLLIQIWSRNIEGLFARFVSSFMTIVTPVRPGCHFALGDAYEICGRDSETMNSSGVHVDFMVGCADLCIMGVTENGETIKVMENG